MTAFTLPPIPNELVWRNLPAAWAVEPDGRLVCTAGHNTDWFIDPNGAAVKSDAPVALFSPAAGDFTLQAKVQVEFAAKFDAGVLMFFAGKDLWAKLCFEFSPQRQPMVVSVVTRGVSDDCNSAVIDGNQVYLRIARVGGAFAFHYSTDGRLWHMVRYFTLGNLPDLRAGLSVQSPTGPGCEAQFSEIGFHPRTLSDIRNGE